MGEESAVAASAGLVERRSERRCPPLPKAAPWLVFPYGKGTKNQAFYNICDEPMNETCRKSIPELSGTRFWQKPCHGDWLLVLCHDEQYDYTPSYNLGDCFLWNPSTLENVKLPSLQRWARSSQRYTYVDCILSSPPDNADSIAMFFYASNYKKYDHAFVYCCPGDKEWRIKNLSQDIIPQDEFVSLCCFKDKLYVMCFYYRHLEIEKQKLGDIDGGGSIKLTIKPFEVGKDVEFPLAGGWDTINLRPIFVESCAELFWISMCYSKRGLLKVVVQILVFRLDFSAMEWKVVKSLGDHVLFLGHSTKACCSAAEVGLARGCLYYTHPNDQSLYKFEIDSTGNVVSLPCLKLPTPWFSSNWIMMTSEQRKKEGEFCEDVQSSYFMKALEGKKSMITSHETGTELQGGKHNGEEATAWEILNEDMVQMIATNLHRLDYLHFRLAWKANRAILPKLSIRSSSTTRCTSLSPWLLFTRNNNRTIYNFLNPMHNNEEYLMNLSEIEGAIIRFQKDGWLLLSDIMETYELFFYKPFTKEVIELPDLPTDGHEFSSISFSSLPTLSDCVVFGIGQLSEKFTMCFIRRGEEFWSTFCFENANIERYMPLHNTPVFYNGLLYSVDYNGTLGVFNIENNSWKVLEKPHEQFSAVYPSFLVECGGELLLVKMGHLGMLVGVFRLDFSEMHWVKVKSLGKYMLFISYTSCISAIAPNRRMENKIYLPRLCRNGQGILFYSLKTGTYQSLESPHSSNFHDTEGWHTNCTWVEPNWSTSNPQELDWLKPLP